MEFHECRAKARIELVKIATDFYKHDLLASSERRCLAVENARVQSAVKQILIILSKSSNEEIYFHFYTEYFR